MLAYYISLVMCITKNGEMENIKLNKAKGIQI